jgi:hypothetical protein
LPSSYAEILLSVVANRARIDGRYQTNFSVSIVPDRPRVKHNDQQIAVKAIESASGAKALTHIEQIAMEQTETRFSRLY